MKLLIVDDNKYVVALLRKQLNWEAFGIEELIGVYSVEQAKEVFLNKQIDFLITDIEMPVQNGFDLLEWLKNQNICPETILLTSYADFSYAQLAVKYQCFDYLLKNIQVVGTPGAGFGENGKNYFRLTSFGNYEKTVEAMERFEKLFG